MSPTTRSRSGVTLNDPVQAGIVDAHEDFTKAYDEGLRRTGMQDNAWRRPRFFHLVQLFRLTRGLYGTTAEAGVFRGLASYLLCHQQRLERADFDGSGHLAIDSFQGLSPATEEDGPRDYRGRFADTSLEIARATLSEFPLVDIVQGWIPDVLDQLPERSYRFVHVDVDLYRPALACLEYFFPRLTPGGLLVVDDYGPWPNDDFPGCRRAVDEFVQQHDLPMSALDTGNALLIGR